MTWHLFSFSRLRHKTLALEQFSHGVLHRGKMKTCPLQKSCRSKMLVTQGLLRNKNLGS